MALAVALKCNLITYEYVFWETRKATHAVSGGFPAGARHHDSDDFHMLLNPRSQAPVASSDGSDGSGQCNWSGSCKACNLLEGLLLQRSTVKFMFAEMALVRGAISRARDLSTNCRGPTIDTTFGSAGGQFSQSHGVLMRL